MKEDKLMDAMALLPEEMLEEAQQLRQKKRVPWKGLAALAACLCLTLGLFLIAPRGKSTEANKNSLADRGNDGYTEKSESAAGTPRPQSASVLGHKFCDREYVDVTVLKVYDGMIGVLDDWQELPLSDEVGDLVSTAYIEIPFALTEGQKLRIYFGDKLEACLEPVLDRPVLLPERIELLK